MTILWYIVLPTSPPEGEKTEQATSQQEETNGRGTTETMATDTVATVPALPLISQPKTMPKLPKSVISSKHNP